MQAECLGSSGSQNCATFTKRVFSLWVFSQLAKYLYIQFPYVVYDQTARSKESFPTDLSWSYRELGCFLEFPCAGPLSPPGGHLCSMWNLVPMGYNILS